MKKEYYQSPDVSTMAVVSNTSLICVSVIGQGNETETDPEFDLM